MTFKANAINHVAAGTELYKESDSIDYIFLLVKGKVEFCTRSAKFQLGAGSFLGLNGCTLRKYTESCLALEDSSVFAFQADSSNSIKKILESNKDYNGVAIHYQNRLILELSKHCKELQMCAEALFSDLQSQYQTYLNELKSSGCRAVLVPGITEIAEFDSQTEVDSALLQYYLELCRVPIESIQNFFTGSICMTLHHLGEQFELVSQLIYACSEALDYIEQVFTTLIGSPEGSLYRSELLLAISMGKKGVSDAAIREAIESNIRRIAEVENLVGNKTNSSLVIDKNMYEYYYTCYTTGTDFSDSGKDSKTIHAQTAADLSSLTNSSKQIMDFVSYPEDKAAALTEVLDIFTNLKDRDNQDDDSRRLRKRISECYYDLYIAVFKKAYGNTNIPKAVELFLNYGYISELLLDDEQLVELLEIKQPEESGPCQVYTIREWLTLIYENKKEPSKNDMGQDYSDVLRQLKKQKKIDDKKEQEMLADGDAKLDYEIHSLFMPANRVVNGQLSIFVPWLYKEQFYGNVSRFFVTRDLVNETCTALLDIDFSVFHREVLYSDPEAGIDREYEMRQVLPVFILLPVAGVNASMWQEITGKHRASEARFLLPTFTGIKLIDLMAKMFGQYRWAYCKTEQGANWNNIQYRSITSEYSDYIQFYKKNRLLSDERKEKIKLQIQRGRNNLREIFAMDYESWVRGEAKGSIKLNKVAREMFASYCPFKRNIRDQLINQPMYEEAFQRFIRERARKIHEIELRYRSLEHKGAVVPEVLLNTLDFYKNS